MKQKKLFYLILGITPVSIAFWVFLTSVIFRDMLDLLAPFSSPVVFGFYLAVLSFTLCMFGIIHYYFEWQREKERLTRLKPQSPLLKMPNTNWAYRKSTEEVLSMKKNFYIIDSFATEKIAKMMENSFVESNIFFPGGGEVTEKIDCFIISAKLMSEQTSLVKDLKNTYGYEASEVIAMSVSDIYLREAESRSDVNFLISKYIFLLKDTKRIVDYFRKI